MKQLIIAFSFLVFASLFIISCDENQAGIEEETESGSIQKSKPDLMVPVEVAIVREKTIQQKINLTGVLMPRKSVDIIAEVSGKVQNIKKNLGDWVSTKDTLAKIDSRVPYSQYNQARAQVFSALNNLNIARLNQASDKDLFNSGDISKLEYENSLLAVKTAEANYLSALSGLSLAEKAFLDTRITSPINGLISRKLIETGTMVSNGMALYRVVDISSLKTSVGVSQNAINLISVGGPAQVTISAMNNFTVPGRVVFISPQADEQTGTFTVEIEIENADSKIKAGMTASVILTVSNFNKQIVIPVHSLITRNGDKAVYKIENKKALLTNINISREFGANVVIESGIARSDSIVVVGMKNLGVNTSVIIETVHE